MTGQVVHRSCFQTTDNKLFTDEKEAKKHQASIDLEVWYEDNQLYGNYAGSRVEFNDLLEWLQRHAAIIKPLL